MNLVLEHCGPRPIAGELQHLDGAGQRPQQPETASGQPGQSVIPHHRVTHQRKKAPQYGALFWLPDITCPWPGMPHGRIASGSAAYPTRPHWRHLARRKAHGRACATESALIRSRLRGASLKLFAKVDYRKTIGPDRATSRIRRTLESCKEGSFLKEFTVLLGAKINVEECNHMNLLYFIFFREDFEK